MEVIPKQIGKDPVIKRLSVKDHINGVITARDDGRTGLRGLRSTANTWLEQDGTVRPRPSLVRYGPQPTGKVLGEIFEYKKVSGSTRENWLICMQSFGVSASPSASVSPSSSASPSASISSSPSSSRSPSSSASLSPSSSLSPSASRSPSSSSSSSPSASRSPSSSVSPSSSSSLSLSPSASRSPSASASGSPSASLSPSSSRSPSSSISASPSAPITSYGQIFIAKIEDASWTAVTGKYFDDNARVHYFQINNKVVIMNNTDSLSYLDIPTATVIPFTTLSNPSAPTLNTNNVGGTGFSITYRITANSTVGETAASNALTVTVDTDRDLWNPPSNGGTDNVIINMPSVASAASYNVYMGTVAGSEYLIASGIPTSATTFTDDGTFIQDTTRLYPTTNSTAGPKATRGANIGGRAFLIGDADNPYYVWNGGDPGFELDFSPANGGGFSLVNNGGKELPMAIRLHRDGKGTPTIKVYCSGTKGKRFSLTADSLTFANTVIPFYDVTEDEGESGTNAPDAILYYNNSMWYPSSEGFETDGTLPQIQNVLATKKASNTIQPDIASLNQDAMDRACGFVFNGRLCYGLPVNSDANNQIWTLDLERKGAWMKPWNIAADWMWVITDNTGNVHHMILSNNILYDMSYSALTSDDGTAIQTSGQSGQIYFSDDKRMWVQLLQVIFVVLRPQGEINFTITGKTEDDPVIGLGEPTNFIAGASSQPAGWGEVNPLIIGWGRNRWSKVNLVPTNINDATQEIPIEVDEEVNWFSYAWNTSKVGVDYNVSDIVAEYIEVGLRDLG